MTTCLICNTSLDFGRTVPIPEDILAKVSPKRTIEEALWEYIQHKPGVCPNCSERLNEFSSNIKDQLLSELTPDRREFLDSITDELKDMSNDKVEAIIASVGSTNIPPEAYEIVSRMIAQEFVVIVAASMLYDRECWSDPEDFIQEVWRK